MATLSSRDAGLKHGWRSGLEEVIGDQLKALRVRFEFEKLRIPFRPTTERHYTPDFVLPNGIIIETKGRFVTADRQKHLLVQSQHPDLDIRFIFSNSRQRISKQSQTTYGMWCDTKGFKYADKVVPQSWIFDFATTPKALAAIAALKKESTK